MVLHRVCRRCGADLEGKARQARFCSDWCCQTWRNERTAEHLRALRAGRPCVGCAAEISAARRANAIYCSDSCKSRSRRQQAYGLSRQELDVLLAQHDRCAICSTDEWGKKGPQVDHNHDTGAVRGVLCGNCNMGLGRFRDDARLLRRAASYLARA